MADTGAISRVLRLLSLLGDRAPLSTRDAATGLGLPPSTAHRLLRRLAEGEFATQTEPGAFIPGPELFRISGRLAGQDPYPRIAQPLLEALASRFDETALLAVLERRALRMYVARSAAPPDPMRYVIELNRSVPLVWGALARAMLAFLSADEIAAAIAGCDMPNASGAPLDPDEVQADLAAIRRDLVCVTHAHRTRHSVGIAAPVFDARGAPICSIGLQIPDFRHDPARMPIIATALREAAAVLAQRLGGAASARAGA